VRRESERTDAMYKMHTAIAAAVVGGTKGIEMLKSVEDRMHDRIENRVQGARESRLAKMWREHEEATKDFAQATTTGVWRLMPPPGAGQ